MRRAEKEITNRGELETILSKATICRIGLIDQNKLYIVPLNFGYKNNCLYFHSALQGKKIELLKKNQIVCFEVDIENGITNTGIPCKWSSTYKSIIGYGNASFITEATQKQEALNILIDHYAPGTSYIFPEKNLSEVVVIKVEITSMTGKKSEKPKKAI
jgi:nitroimidazol reductase NimA-like FMN-containing flavoprotein (pyridoxamine 5'-phosphate oxidase superfamily)